MATQGPLYPGTTANLSNAGSSENTDAWVNPGNVVSDNGVEATITAASYDSPDISQILVCSNLGFTIPAGATIDGITVEIDRRSIIASSGKDFRVQLAKGTTFAALVGSNKAVPATIWPTTIAVASYGGGADLWGTTWTAAEINASSFAVFLSAQANIANADIGVDFVRVTVTYTPPADTALAGSSAGASTAAAALQTAITLGGSSAGVATALGDLTTAIALAGSSAGGATAAGVLTSETAIQLVGSSAGSSDATGALTTGIALVGSSAGAAGASGDLATAIALAGASGGVSDAAALLATAIALAGQAGGTSAAVGALSDVAPPDTALAGSAAGSSDASATLTTAIRLFGSSAGSSDATASLLTSIALAGETGGVAAGAASLATAIALAGTAAGGSSAVAALTVGSEFIGGPPPAGHAFVVPGSRGSARTS